MNECMYCQGDVKPEDQFEVTAPDKTKWFVCPDCMKAVVTFFKADWRDELEENKSPINLEGTYLSIFQEGDKHGQFVVLDGKNKQIIHTFDNVKSHSFRCSPKTKRFAYFDANRRDLYSLYGVPAPVIEDQKIWEVDWSGEFLFP